MRGSVSGRLWIVRVGLGDCEGFGGGLRLTSYLGVLTIKL